MEGFSIGAQRGARAISNESAARRRKEVDKMNSKTKISETFLNIINFAALNNVLTE
jgi:hypothetical protein